MTVMNLQTLVSVLHGQLKVPVSALGPDARRNLITVVVNGAMFTFAPPIKPDTADKKHVNIKRFAQRCTQRRWQHEHERLHERQHEHPRRAERTDGSTDE